MIQLRDMSHYDTNLSLNGFVGTTHKVTEGTSYIDPTYQARMNTFKVLSKILGSYHVLHTGNLAAQMGHWFRTLDDLTPWWRSYPRWIMQIDAEKWPTDKVPAQTVKDFADMVTKNWHGFTITYASQGQFGDNLRGIVTPLWNANYNGGNAGWVSYSGQMPLFWQYTSTPFDKNYYQGTEAALSTIIERTPDVTPDQDRLLKNCERILTTECLGEKPFGIKFSASDPGRELPNPFSNISTGGLTDADRTAIKNLTDAVNALNSRLTSP